MRINADKTHLWKADTRASVDPFNKWFQKFAPDAYRKKRIETIGEVERGLLATSDLMNICPSILEANPATLAVLRMSTCPPIAQDRLVGLADCSKGLVKKLEKGELPTRGRQNLNSQLTALTDVVNQMLDVDIFPWLGEKRSPSIEERYRSSTIIADRLCGSKADPIVRNAQEQRQLDLIQRYLVAKGYQQKTHASVHSLNTMQPHTFSFRQNVLVTTGERLEKTRIPVDVVIQPASAVLPHLPILIEAKSAGDFTNTNKRRKEEAAKIQQLHKSYGKGVKFLLFLCGYFDAGYLGYEASEGIDWIWEHRMEDLDQLGV